MEKPKRKGKPKDEQYPDWRWIATLTLFVLGIPLLCYLTFHLVRRIDGIPDRPEAITVPFELVVVPFNKIEPTLTQNTYSGTVTLNISGTGQAGNTDWSDAFYLYAHEDYVAYDPPLLQYFALEIDGQRAIETLGLLENPPPYSSDHTYTVTYNVGTEPRRITFRISDSTVGDNTGEFRIEIYGGQ
mgnify:CR=1 FL=1